MKFRMRVNVLATIASQFRYFFFPHSSAFFVIESFYSQFLYRVVTKQLKVAPHKRRIRIKGSYYCCVVQNRFSQSGKHPLKMCFLFSSNLHRPYTMVVKEISANVKRKSIGNLLYCDNLIREMRPSLLVDYYY